MNGPLDRLGSVDFERLFVDEPPSPDPAADLGRGRRLRRRRRIGIGAVTLVALVVVGGAVGGVARDSAGLAGPVAGPSPAPSVAPTPAASPSPTGTPRDTAPALERDADGSYLDADGQHLGGSITARDPGAQPFHRTTENSWRLAVRHLDPGRDHLADYERDSFSGGGGAGSSSEIGQKIGWTVKGDPGEGMIQLAVARLDPGARPRLGRLDGDGFCGGSWTPDEPSCRRTTVAGRTVYYWPLPGGGFVMDRLQADGEVASILVNPVFPNNTDVAVRTLDITPETAAALLDDPALDVVG